MGGETERLRSSAVIVVAVWGVGSSDGLRRVDASVGLRRADASDGLRRASVRSVAERFLGARRETFLMFAMVRAL